MSAKQRDGPTLVKKMLIAFLHGLLIDVAVAAIFLGIGALLFGPVTDQNIVKAVFVLGVGVVCIFSSVLLILVRAIVLSRAGKDQ